MTTNAKIMDFMIQNHDNAEARIGGFELFYFSKFGRLAHPQRQDTFEGVMSKVNQSSDIKKELLTLIDTEGIEVEEAVKKIASTATTSAMTYTTNYFVAMAVVNSTVSVGVTHGGRRAAVFAIEQTAGLAAAQGANVAVQGMKLISSMPALSAAVGEVIGSTLASKLGVTNYHVKNGMAVGGSIAGGATVGAVVGGPVGAAAGAAVGVVSWGTGQAIGALINSKLGIKGPNDNWCYIKTGSSAEKRTNKVCFGTYAPGDTMYWKTYWNEHKHEDEAEFVMSAGQGKSSSFQLCVWDRKNKVLKHFNQVFFRDCIWVHSGYVIHCKGEHHGAQAGTVDMYRI